MRALPPALLAAALLLTLPASSAPFLQPDEVASGLADADASARVNVVTIGLSEERREVRMAIVADPPVASPADVGGRAVTLLYTQQHGDEPAGTPAALRLLKNLTGKLGDEVLANQVVLVIPQVNPDGAVAGTRGNAQDTDTNRDHLNLTSAAARIVHEVVLAWRPVVAVDHHEYSGYGTGLGPARLYDFDATILWPNHANVDRGIVDAAVAVNAAMREALASEGYSVGDYGKLTVNGVPVTDLAGGPQPSIARNHYGLHHAASLLVESRVDDPNQQAVTGDGASRRIRVHELTMEATLRHVAANAAALRAVRDASAQAALGRALALDGGGEVPLPKWGYGALDADVADVLAAHGLPVENGTVAIGNELRAHAGLLLEAASPWNVTLSAARLDTDPRPGRVPTEEATPFGAWIGVAAFALALPLRRRHG